jgi:hypothetical protein
MIAQTMKLTDLYEADETAWLETMAELVAAGRYAELDQTNLSEYLADMAKRDRREVASRLVTLLLHLLKWEHQPERRSGSWERTILEQRRELGELLESGTLRNHALAILAKAYASACQETAAETGLPPATFPAECPWDLETLIGDEGEAS